jgi:hypothetical protein
MNSRTELSLAEQREMLRQQLSAQRNFIERQLEPERANTTYSNGRPHHRHNILVFLKRRPGLAIGLLAGAATLLVVGRRFSRHRLLGSIPTVLAVARMVQSAVGKRRLTNHPWDDGPIP